MLEGLPPLVPSSLWEYYTKYLLCVALILLVILCVNITSYQTGVQVEESVLMGFLYQLLFVLKKIKLVSSSVLWLA